MKQVYIKKINSELEYLKDKLSETEYLEFVNTGILKFYNFLVKNETLQIFLSIINPLDGPTPICSKIVKTELICVMISKSNASYSSGKPNIFLIDDKILSFILSVAI